MGIIKICAFLISLYFFFLICILISLCVNKYIVNTEEKINVDVCLCSGAFLCTCHAAGVGKQAEGELHGSSARDNPISG